MQNIIITLVFSIVMLFFMLYPAMLIVEFISKHKEISETTQKILLITITLILSIGIGIFLKIN
jgi:hypothetical protein